MNRRRYPLPADPGHSSNGIARASDSQATTDLPTLIFPWGNPQLLQSPSSTPLPPYFRCTVSAIPATRTLSDGCGVPLGLIVHPASATDVPVIDYSAGTVPRCDGCLAYLSPFCELSPSGKVWKCCCCGRAHQCADFTFSEFTKPVYDILAPPDFLVAGAAGPSFLFLFDFSSESVASGFTQQCLASVRAIAESLPDATRVCVMTMSNAITVFDLTRVTEFVVADTADPVLTCRTTSPLGGCRRRFSELLTHLMQRPGAVGAGLLGVALTISQRALFNVGGIVVACVAGSPAVGLSGEAAVAYFRDLGGSLNEESISVHLFVLAPGDVATINHVSGRTGGEIRSYRSLDRSSLHTDLFHCLSASYLWDASVKLRATTGIHLLSVSANCAIRERIVYIPVLSAHHALAFEFCVDGTITRQNIVFQCATLFTTSGGVRTIRVMNFSLPAATLLAQINVDEAAIAAFLTKRCAGLVTNQGLKGTGEAIRATLKAMIARAHRVVSLYDLVHSLLCSPLLWLNHPGGADGRIAELVNARVMTLDNCLLYLYPRMFAVDATEIAPLPLIPASFEEGYLIVFHMYERVFVWINPECPEEIVRAFFGATEIPTEVPQTGTAENTKLNKLIEECCAWSHRYLPVEIIPPRSPRQAIFADILVNVASDPYLTVLLSEITMPFR